MPCRRREMEISLDTMPTMEIGIAYGVTFLPRSTKKSKYCRSPTSMPTPPLPVITTRGVPEWRIRSPTICEVGRGLFVWLGGAMFVGALAYCAYSYTFPWGRTLPFTPRAIAADAALFTVFALHHSLFAR